MNFYIPEILDRASLVHVVKSANNIIGIEAQLSPSKHLSRYSFMILLS